MCQHCEFIVFPPEKYSHWIIIKGIILTEKLLICELKAQEKSNATKEIKIGQFFLFLRAPKNERGRHLVYAKG
jgi:hypothetical protein